MESTNNNDYSIVADIFIWCNDISAMRDFYSKILGMKEFSFSTDGLYDYLGYEINNGPKLFFLSHNKNLEKTSEWSKQPAFVQGTLERTSWTVRIP